MISVCISLSQVTMLKLFLRVICFGLVLEYEKMLGQCEFVWPTFFSVCTTSGFAILIYHPGCILFGGIFVVLLSTSEDSNKRRSCFPLYVGQWIHISFAIWEWSCRYSTYNYIYTMNFLSTFRYPKKMTCIFWDMHTEKYLDLLKLTPSLLTLIHMKSIHNCLWNTTKMPSLSVDFFAWLYIYVYMHAFLCWPGFWINTSPVPAEMYGKLMFSVSQNEEFLFKRPFAH